MKSTRYAAAIAVAYAALAAVYIIASGYLAAGVSRSVEDLQRLETIKGVVYVVVTAALIFAGTRWAMRRMERDAAELIRCEQALVINEGRIFAGLTAASIAHDANNVLTIALADVTMLGQHLQGDERLDRLQASVERLIALNKRLLDSAQAMVTRERTRLDLTAATKEAVAMLRPHLSVRNCRVSVSGKDGIFITASPAVVNQMVGNLVLNAGEATGGRGVIDVRVMRSDGMAVVEVHDNGPGVPEPRRHDIFGVLATTKPEGHGIGLFSVKACAIGLGGGVEVTTSPLGGALFRIRLPLAESAEVNGATVTTGRHG